MIIRINKKIMLGTWLGIAAGAGFFAVIDIYEKMNMGTKHEVDMYSWLAVLTGACSGGFLGFLSSSICCYDEERSAINDETYREFFESQQIIDNVGTAQLSNEATPLLEAHIVEINNEQLGASSNNYDCHVNSAKI